MNKDYKHGFNKGEAKAKKAGKTYATQTYDAHYNPACVGCQYYSTHTYTCDYILITGHRRPCPPGKDCTAKVKGPKLKCKDLE